MTTGSTETATITSRIELDVVLVRVELSQPAPEQGDPGGPEHGPDTAVGEVAGASIRPTPAMTVMNVRTIGTNRASTMAAVAVAVEERVGLVDVLALESRESGALEERPARCRPIS